MPAYKIIYFNVKALAEPMRLLLSYGNIDFEDVRVERDGWSAMKPTMPMGQMPILEVDGKRAHQSLAITRYLAKQVGLVGADAWEDLEIDSVVDTINDMRLKIAAVPVSDFKAKLDAVHYEQDFVVEESKREAVSKETVPYYLEKLEEIAKLNNGHFALKKLTWADFYFTGILDYLRVMVGHDLVAGYPSLKKVVDNVLKIESIKKWIAKRPQTEF